MMTINISGLSKAEVIKALYDNSIPVGLGYEDFIPGDMPMSEAEYLAEREYLDYVHGRYMKCSLHGDNILIDEMYNLLNLRVEDMEIARRMGVTKVPKRAEDVIAALRGKK